MWAKSKWDNSFHLYRINPIEKASKTKDEAKYTRRNMQQEKQNNTATNGNKKCTYGSKLNLTC